MSEWKYDPARDLDLTTAESLKSVRREVGLPTTLSCSLRWIVVRAYLRAFHRWVVHGREHLPKKLPFILVSNHASHLDALALAAALPAHINRRVFPVAAGDTFFETRPAAAFAALFMNALPLWRNKCQAHSLHDLRQRLLDEPCGYIVFPEGTRSRDGTIGRFKPGIGKLVAGSSVPVVPCRLIGVHEALSPDRRFPRPAKIQLRISPAQSFAASANTREGWNSIAQSLHQAVAG